MRTKTIARYGLVALTVATAALGCTREETLRLILPDGYKGRVTVSCAGLMDDNETVKVEPSGRVSNARCPADEAHVVVIRNGVIVQPAGGVAWVKTGDGIPVGLNFEVK